MDCRHDLLVQPSALVQVSALVAFILSFAPVKHHDRALTLLFGSDGQLSLIGFDGGTQTQPPGAMPTLATSNTGGLTQGTPLPKASTSVSPVPNLEATSTSAPLTSSASFTFTIIPPSLTSSSYDPSSTTTTMDTDTNLPSIPTINYPTPTPTAVSDPRDQGVGAPFYLAVVLASISFVGCVSAFVAWWIRSRTRRRDLEFDDPWDHHKAMSDGGGSFTDNGNESSEGIPRHAEVQTRPYYLPASIVRSSSSNLLAVPHTISTSEDATFQNAVPRTILDSGPLRRGPQNMDSGPNPLSSQVTNLHSRPGTERLQTGLSVQESTRTLGRLRVANRVPGDVTSGDEGGMNIQNSAGVFPGANLGGTNFAVPGEKAMQGTRVGESESIQEGNSLLEPPGPATLSWGRRIDTVAALRRSRRRSPETTVQTHKNPKYGGYLYPTLDGRQSDTASQRSFAVGPRENKNILVNPPADYLGWTNSLKSSFWQAVDAMTKNRPSDPEHVHAANAGNGSRFTPAPQRVTSRRSPVSLARSVTSTATDTNRSQETETKPELTLTDNFVFVQESPLTTTYSGTRSSSTRINELGMTSYFNRDFGPSTHTRPPSVLKTETGSVYSTESATGRTALHRYRQTDSIPSSWSALGTSRQSQLELSRLFLPLPRPMPSSRPGPPSIAPSQPPTESSFRSGSTSERTHTAMHSESDILASDASALGSGTSANTAGPGHRGTATSSASSMLSEGTIQSGRSTMAPGTGPSPSSSTTSSMLSRKKGVTRRKRPRPPPRAPSTASSIQSVESGLSVREVAVRKALLERRKKVKAAESLKDHEDNT